MPQAPSSMVQHLAVDWSLRCTGRRRHLGCERDGRQAPARNPPCPSLPRRLAPDHGGHGWELEDACQA